MPAMTFLNFPQEGGKKTITSSRDDTQCYRIKIVTMTKTAKWSDSVREQVLTQLRQTMWYTHSQS